MNCTYCGAQIADNVNFCPSCGAPVTMAQKSAMNQQAQQQTAQQVPPVQPVQPQVPPVQQNYPVELEQKSKLAAGLLAIFVGSLGIHNFYLGNKSRGMIQLLVSLIGGVFTCGLATIGIQIWALVEGIQIFTGSIATDAYGIPLKE